MSGIQTSEINASMKAIEKRTSEQIRFFFDFLCGLRDGPVQKVLAVYRLREPDYWERLRSFGQENNREQKLLKAELKFLRIAWRQRNEQVKEKSPTLNDSDPQSADELPVRSSS